MAKRTVYIAAVIGLCVAGGLVALGQHFGRIEPILDALTGPDEPEPGPIPAIKLVEAFPKLKFEFPLWFGHDGTGSGWLYVVGQDGKIWRFKPDSDAPEVFFDITDRLPTRRQRHNEEGLLALAFHPKFAQNRHFFVNYSQLKGETKPRRGIISRFTAPKDGGVTDLATEKIIMEVEQPWGNHNGCSLNFGADGFLYASWGDGGSGGDPHNHGQNLATLLGTVVRIDVDKEERGLPYAIPPDNPFVGKEGARPEIWAWGLRNVWRMAFDAKTGLLWGGDVGQVTLEEIDIIEKGGNYGWNWREGTRPYRRGDAPAGLIDPVAEYGRDMGISVTGGVVYRGNRFERLQGVYLYADYGSGRIWGLKYDAAEKRVLANQLVAHEPRATISSFGEDADGEVYVCAHFRQKLYRIEVAD